MKKWSLFLLLLAVAAFAVQPAAAQAPDTKHKIYLYLAEVMPMSDGEIDGETTEASDELGYGLGYEFRLNKLMGLDFDLMMSSHDVEYAGETLGSIDFMPFSASLNFHLFGKGLVDLYVGPTLGYVMWGDFEIDSQYQQLAGADKFSVGDEFAYGASAGIDIGGKRFAFTGGLRYLMVDASPDDVPGDVGVDPLIIRAGFAYKF